MKTRAKLMVAAAVLLIPGALMAANGSGVLPYADTVWRTVHASPSNDDFVPIDVGRGFRLAWTALEGAATPAAPTVGPEGNIYQATGLGPGNSNLTALDQDGNILWQSEPWEDASGLDSCACLQGPVIDYDGDVYVADCNQLWAFHSDGGVKWVVDLPAAPPGAPFQDGIPRNPPLTAFFMNDGAVGVATYFGQVAVWSRDGGAPLADVLELPGGPGPFPIPAPPGSFAGVADPGVVDVVFNVAFGIYGEVVDTPAVHPETGRVYILGSGSAAGTTSIYGIDFVPGTGLVPAFETVVGAGGGASPAISPDLTTVYTTDAAGILTGIDAETGAVVLSVQTSNTRPQSPAVGPDGRIYLGEGQAIDPDGTIAWEADFSGLLAWLVGDQTQILPFLTPRISGVITVTNDKLLYPVVVNITLDPAQFPFLPQPVDVPLKLVYVTADPETGELLPSGVPYVAMENENSAFTVPLENGLVVANRGGFAVPLTGPLAPLANGLVQSIAPGIDLVAQSAALGGLEAFQAIDEARIEEIGDPALLADGVVSSGDFLVDLEAGRRDMAVSGEAEIGGQLVTPKIWNLGSRRHPLYVGTIEIENLETGDKKLLVVATNDLEAGFQAAGGNALGLDLETYELFIADWLIRDWS